MITGVDIVQEQIRVASGEPLSVTQDQIKVNGHAIELSNQRRGPRSQLHAAGGPDRERSIRRADSGSDWTPTPVRDTGFPRTTTR